MTVMPPLPFSVQALKLGLFCLILLWQEGTEQIQGQGKYQSLGLLGGNLGQRLQVA